MIIIYYSTNMNAKNCIFKISKFYAGILSGNFKFFCESCLNFSKLLFVLCSPFLFSKHPNPYISCHWWYKLSDIVFKYKFFDIVLEFHNYDFNFIYSVIRIKHCMLEKIELISRPKFYFQIYTTLLDEWQYKHGQCNTRVNKYLYLGG